MTAPDAVLPDRPDEGAKRALLALGFLAFLHLGGLQAAYGPSFAALQARHAVGVAEVGASVSAHFLGGFVGVLVSSLSLAAMGYRRVLLGATMLTGAGAAAVGFAPSWQGVLLGALLIGFGYGHAVVLYNLLFARAFAPAGASAVNLVNGAFGVGAVALPAAVALVTARLVAVDPARIAQATPIVFGGAALLALAVAVAIARVPWLPAPVGRPRPRAAAATAGARSGSTSPAAPSGRLVGAVAAFACAMFLYVASEVATASWAPTHVAQAVGPARAALAASVFWIAMTAGRFLAAAFAARVRPGDLVLAAALLALVGLALARVPGAAFVGYAVAGVGLAPVFPTLIVWLDRHFGRDAERVAPIVLGAGNLGPVLGAPAVGLAVAATGPAAVPVVLAAVAVALVATIWATRRATRRAEAAAVG